MPKLVALTIYVDDLDQAREFYCDKLGYDIAYTMENIIALQSEGIYIVLEKASTKNKLRYPESSQVVMGLETENLDKTCEVLGKLGVKFVHDSPQDFPRGRFVGVYDPAGNVIEILEFKKEE